MGMCGVLCRVSARRLARLQADPARVGVLVSNSMSGQSPRALPLEKTWDALDKAFTIGGLDTPLADAIHGRRGRELGGPLAYATAHYLAPAQVVDVSNALLAFPESELRKHWRGGALDDAYVFGDLRRAASRPTPYDDLLADVLGAEDDEDLQELVEALRALVRFYGTAARRGDGMLTALA